MNSLNKWKVNNKIVTMSDGFTIPDESHVDLINIAGEHLPDDCIFKRLDVPKRASGKYSYIDSKIDCYFGENILEMLFFDNILYLIEKHSDKYFMFSIIHFEKSSKLSLDSIRKWYDEKSQLHPSSSNMLVVKEPNDWNLSYYELLPRYIKKDSIKKVTLADLFGLAFNDTDLYVYNMNLTFQKVISITRDCTNDEVCWDELIKTNPLFITNYRYKLILENGMELYMFWSEFSQLLNQYVITHNSLSEHDKPKRVNLIVPDFYKF